ncbi:unnamed protein product [Dibothriocephalus latus]|uniref:Uncharacterized protein n=1 Tax=Dibothriocephalus latus TaxID=60516 RepID=A0A3P7N5U1_DIBLA|nr:unnamed protein product [Dibothriocephalus latus]
MDEKPGHGPSDKDSTLGGIVPSSPVSNIDRDCPEYQNPNAHGLDTKAADPLCPDSKTSSSSSTDLPEQTNQLTDIEQNLRALHRQMKAFSKKHQQLAKKYRQVFVKWCGDRKCNLSDLEAAVTKRLHNYSDAHAKRIRSAKAAAAAGATVGNPASTIHRQTDLIELQFVNPDLDINMF